MAFTAKILSWRFRHLNIVGCLLKRRPTKGGSRAPQDSLATPLNRPSISVLKSSMAGNKKNVSLIKRMYLVNFPKLNSSAQKKLPFTH